LEKIGRKWKLKKGAIQIIHHFLKIIGEAEYLIGGMEKTIAIVRTFGIGDNNTNKGDGWNSDLQLTVRAYLIF